MLSAGIIPEEVVEPMPELLVALVKRLVRWGVLPARMAPDSAIINIYDEVCNFYDSADVLHAVLFCDLSLAEKWTSLTSLISFASSVPVERISAAYSRGSLHAMN